MWMISKKTGNWIMCVEDDSALVPCLKAVAGLRFKAYNYYGYYVSVC